MIEITNNMTNNGTCMVYLYSRKKFLFLYLENACNLTIENSGLLCFVFHSAYFLFFSTRPYSAPEED